MKEVLFDESNEDRPKKRKHEAISLESLQSRKAEIQKERALLPISSCQHQILKLVEENKVMVIVGETGSGKTTQITQMLLHGGFAKKGAIACTQPRRVAAMSVARRVAEEMGTRLGHKVGYSIRFDDCTSAETKIKYCTDGMLLRECLIDPSLSRYQVVLVDEAHERTVQTDVLLGLLKGVVKKRGDDFRLIVMSATLDASKFVSYFPGAKAAKVLGRTHPISLYYTAMPEDSYLDAAFNCSLQIHHEEGPGDILVFLTGQDEIESMQKMIEDASLNLKKKSLAGLASDQGAPKRERPEALSVVSIYASMPPEQQMRVFESAPDGVRKVILATNIAETSITINNVRFVVDTGFVKARDYNAKLGADSLQVVPVSQAQARQRSGRAGREAPGKAFRLYTERAFLELQPMTLPEIQRSNLGSVMLQLKAMGIHDVLNFDFLDPPPGPAVIRSLELLHSLGALDDSGKLTEEVGKRMSRLPVEPQFAKVLLSSCRMHCSLEAIQVVAMVSADNIFFCPREKREQANAARLKFTNKDGDHLTMLNVVRAFIQVPRKERVAWCSDNFLNVRSLSKAVDICEQLQSQLRQLDLPISSCGDNLDHIRKALITGLFMNAARMQPDGGFKVLATGQMVFIHPSSVLCGKKPECIVFSELVRTNKAYAREVTALEVPWLVETCPHAFMPSCPHALMPSCPHAFSSSSALNASSAK